MDTVVAYYKNALSVSATLQHSAGGAAALNSAFARRLVCGHVDLDQLRAFPIQLTPD